MERVIIAIPYTSIIEQTAAVCREALGENVVLEHHSAVPQDDPENPTPEEIRGRLASENWDVPVVVTTTVQLFESLFASKTTRCRKLHNIAKCVLVLDEVQMLPTHLLEPVLDVLRQLVAHYGVSVVLCTATQPALQESPYLKGLPNVREIAPDPGRLFAELKRVRYEWPKDRVRVTWWQVADEMRKEEQALAVVNTKAEALALLDALHNPEALHLSTLMCGAHRRDALNEIRARLNDGAPCHLVSTQVVEAGVDLDFPLVLRALGPLDRIVQAAGRCNREGKLPELGRVVVFEPEQAKLPTGTYRTGTALAAMRLLAPGFDFDDPRAYEEYFQLLYQAADLDTKNIQDLRRNFSYAEIAQRFRMIQDDTLPVVVRPPGEHHSATVDELMAELHGQQARSRWLFRALQPYLVSVWTRFVPAYQKQGLLRQVTPNLWEWLGHYDPVRGLDARNRDPEELVV
jgi:CRISPR-associated endonuclease/helicase Cas3